MSDITISARGIGKRYDINRQKSLLSRLKNAAGKQDAAAGPSSFWALDNIDFDIRQGEAVGIIGKNGAGKSTLLKVLSRITEPTSGQATIHGRVGSLLEVGTGFHPELTGRENIFMNGSILGMKRSEIARQLDAIVEFAEISQFVDTPVKRYSSGMYVRLAFSVAAHLEPEVLIVDEVLAVGDIQFQKRCLGKMDDVSKSGRTVLFVSHNMTAISQLTNRCILLKQGKVAFDGNTNTAVELYSEGGLSDFIQGQDLSAWPRPKNADLNRIVEFNSLEFDKRESIFAPGSDLIIHATVTAKQRTDRIRISGTIFQFDGVPVGSFFTHDSITAKMGERINLRTTLSSTNLAPGAYSLALALGHGTESTGHRDYDIVFDVLPFEVSAISGSNGTIGAWTHAWGPIRFPQPQIEVTR
jgi:lipopolysaccharide transport system ATP-binding protein